MVSWKRVTEAIEWQEVLSALKSANYLHTWAWGEYRSHFGWQPVRCVANDDGGRAVSLVQFLVRLLPAGIGMAWVPGGVQGDLSVWGPSLLDCLREATPLRHAVLRINDFRPYSANDALQLYANGWRRSPMPLTSGLSMILPIDNSAEERRSALSKNWRHNLNRFDKTGLCVERWEEPDLDEIDRLYKEMESLKMLPEQISRHQLEKMFSCFGENILLCRCRDGDGRLIAIRACAVVGERAWDLMAAAGEKARTLYASYGVLWKLIQECHKRGVKLYDLSGIDPQKNKGVWFFKRGTGAETVEYLGEWEISSSKLLRRSMNAFLAMKGGGS